MSVHPDKTAFRAVEACGGTYTNAEADSRYAEGHTDALHDALLAVKACDALTAELFSALDGLVFTISVTAIKYAEQLPGLEKSVTEARAAIAKATGEATA